MSEPSGSSGRRSRKKWWFLGGGAVVVLVTGGVVAAKWSSNATGSGSDKALSAVNLTVVANATPTADLFPGGTGALQFTVNNPNPYSVTLTTLTPGTISSSDSTNCPIANVSVTGGTLGTPIVVPAAGTSGAVSLAGKVSMVLTAPDGCQGVVFTVAVTLAGTQT